MPNWTVPLFILSIALGVTTLVYEAGCDGYRINVEVRETGDTEDGECKSVSLEQANEDASDLNIVYPENLHTVEKCWL